MALEIRNAILEQNIGCRRTRQERDVKEFKEAHQTKQFFNNSGVEE